MHASTAGTYSIHQLKVFIFEDTLRASRWQPIFEALCEIWNCSRINWMQFDQVLVLLFDQGVDAFKPSKSFEDRAHLFIVVGKLVEVLVSALAMEDRFCQRRSLEACFEAWRIVQRRRSGSKNYVRSRKMRSPIFPSEGECEALEVEAYRHGSHFYPSRIDDRCSMTECRPQTLHKKAHKG